MTRAPERHTKSIGRLPQTQSVEPGQLQRPPLAGGKLREAGADHPAAFFGRQASRVEIVRRLRGVERLTAIRCAVTQAGLATEGPSICVLEEPDAYRSSRGIVEVRLAVHLEEDFLRDVFGLGGIAKDVRGDAVNQAGVTEEEGAHRLPFGGVQSGDQFGVRRIAHFPTL
jgi:hypothetical protein